MPIETNSYGQMHDGTRINRYVLKNESGLCASIINYGAIVESVHAPDRHGSIADIVLGFDNLDDWVERNTPYFGAVIGRCANRIGAGKFSIDDEEYQLAINNGPNCLHGGLVGFDKKVWKVEDATGGDEPSVRMSLGSPDGDENFPGNLLCTVVYTLRADNGLQIEYEAETDKPTIVNLTNHSYFNLGGHDSGHIGDHIIQVESDLYTPNDENTLPTGEIVSLDGKAFDFRKPKKISECLREIGAVDHNYMMRSARNPDEPVATLIHPDSGRRLEVATTEPGMQLYSADYLDGICGKCSAVYQPQTAICLEAQRCPDAVNHENFPNVILRPGDIYHQKTTYRITADG